MCDGVCESLGSLDYESVQYLGFGLRWAHVLAEMTKSYAQNAYLYTPTDRNMHGIHYSSFFVILMDFFLFLFFEDICVENEQWQKKNNASFQGMGITNLTIPLNNSSTLTILLVL